MKNPKFKVWPAVPSREDPLPIFGGELITADEGKTVVGRAASVAFDFQNKNNVILAIIPSKSEDKKLTMSVAGQPSILIIQMQCSLCLNVLQYAIS